MGRGQLKTVKVHDDTHAALKRLKKGKRSRSIDRVIREMIRDSGEVVVPRESGGEGKMTEFLDE